MRTPHELHMYIDHQFSSALSSLYIPFHLLYVLNSRCLALKCPPGQPPWQAGVLYTLHRAEECEERYLAWARRRGGGDPLTPPLATQREGQGTLAWTHWEPDWSNLAPAGINNTNNPGTGQRFYVWRKFWWNKLSQYELSNSWALLVKCVCWCSCNKSPLSCQPSPVLAWWVTALLDTTLTNWIN